MPNESSNEKWEDSAITTVRNLSNEGNLIASLHLCSALVEYYCTTRLFIFLTPIRFAEIIKVQDKKTNKMKNASVLCKIHEIIFPTNNRVRFSHAGIIDIGLLVGAWNYELWKELKRFNKDRNRCVHQPEYILKILKKDDEKKVKRIIEQGLALLHNIKLGYIEQTKSNREEKQSER